MILVLNFDNKNSMSSGVVLINVPPKWPGSSLKIIKANSYVRHNFI